MTEPNYPMQYHGESNESMMYGDPVRIVREMPPLHKFDNGDVLIGKWVEVEHYYDGERFYAPAAWFSPRKS